MDGNLFKRKCKQRIVVWTQKEKKELSNPYFQILRVTEEYYELQSKNTGHLWIIKKQFLRHPHIMLYHKHSPQIPYYHKQCRIYTVKQAVNIIEKHDRYILQTYESK